MEKKQKVKQDQKKIEKPEPVWKKVTIGGSMFGNKLSSNYGGKMKAKPNKVFRGVR